MGEGMSKRLKVQLGSEAEMEERAFNNPYPDYQSYGSTASASTTLPTPSDSEDNRCSSASPQRDDSLPSKAMGRSLALILGSFPSRPFSTPKPMEELGTRANQSSVNVRNWIEGCFLISSYFNKKITTKIKDLLQQMEEGLKQQILMTALHILVGQLYHVTKEPTHLQRSLDYVKRILRNLNGRRVTFLCGDAGPLAVGAVVYHKMKNDSESKECVAKLLQLQRIVLASESDLPDELLYGRSGYLYALLYLNTEIDPETVPQSVIKEVVESIIQSGKNFSREERKTERCPLLYQWHRKQYVGAAHGVAGIYYMLMQPAANVDQEILMELLKPSIDYVRHKKFRSGNYPSSLSNETDRLVHWCHGAPGVIHMLMQAYKVFKEDKYLKDAMECSDVIWQRGLLRKGYGICHGTAGNGYSFLSLYHLTQDKKYLYRACKFAEWCLDYGAHGCRIPDRPYSLFEGMAGAIHFLSDILVPEKSHFPAFELSPQMKENKEKHSS